MSAHPSKSLEFHWNLGPSGRGRSFPPVWPAKTHMFLLYLHHDGTHDGSG
jgi:hypothetical protein